MRRALHDGHSTRLAGEGDQKITVALRAASAGEAANSLIQAAKAKARGYGTTHHLITIAYLVAGKLTHLPASPFDAARAPVLRT